MALCYIGFGAVSTLALSVIHRIFFEAFPIEVLGNIGFDSLFRSLLIAHKRFMKER